MTLTRKESEQCDKKIYVKLTWDPKVVHSKTEDILSTLVAPNHVLPTSSNTNSLSCEILRQPLEDGNTTYRQISKDSARKKVR